MSNGTAGSLAGISGYCLLFCDDTTKPDHIAATFLVLVMHSRRGSKVPFFPGVRPSTRNSLGPCFGAGGIGRLRIVGRVIIRNPLRNVADHIVEAKFRLV